jgi:hypothetical protein
MDEITTKICPLCCERINLKARKCPHCQHFQNKWVLMAYHPAVAIAPMTLVLIVSFFLLIRAISPGEDFESHRAQIHVVQSAMQFGEHPGTQSLSGPIVAVVGTVRNDSGITWKDAIIEVKFFDKDHNLIDAKQQRDYSEVVLPGQTCAFKVSMSRDFSADKYVSYEVNVVSARDGRGIFP